MRMASRECLTKHDNNGTHDPATHIEHSPTRGKRTRAQVHTTSVKVMDKLQNVSIGQQLSQVRNEAAPSHYQTAHRVVFATWGSNATIFRLMSVRILHFRDQDV